MSTDPLVALGHAPEPVLRAIRRKCICAFSWTTVTKEGEEKPGFGEWKALNTPALLGRRSAPDEGEYHLCPKCIEALAEWWKG